MYPQNSLTVTASRRLRVLFVDDDPLAGALFERVLTNHDAAVQVAQSGDQALELAQVDAYDVIVADVYMPGLGGLQLAARLSEVLPDTPIVLVTGDTELELSHGMMRRQNICAVVFKPWNDAELVRTLRHAEASKRPSRRPSANGEPTRVLLVEDNKGDAALAESYLRRGYHPQPEVVHVGCVQDAVKALEGDSFTVALLDLSLPDAVGLSAIRRVRAASVHTPVIVLSGTNDKALSLQALQAGAQDYLVKDQISSGLLSRAVSHAVERKRAEERLTHLAEHDQITGLVNRGAFHTRLGRVLARCRRENMKTALFYLDIDQFKVVNDSLGHHVGDQVLCAVAAALRGAVRNFETVARLGGDEFAVVVERVDAEADALVIADRLLRVTQSAIDSLVHGLSVSASVGIAIYPENGESIEALLQSADAAMYRAKAEGASRQFYSREMHENEIQRQRAEWQLRKVVSGKHFCLHYQPIYRVHDVVPVGFEALLRIDRPPLHQLSPAKFIPMIERLRLANEVGKWVLKTACDYTAALHHEGGPCMRVSVNLSASELHDENLPTCVAEVLSESGLPAEYLELEITETAVMEDIEVARRTMERLKNHVGVRLAMDDFGTGYSSLAYLKKFPIDTLKVDKLFIDDLSKPDSSSLVSGIIALGHSLGMEVTAEGVEDEQQLAALRAHGCDFVQGYLLARPVPADQLRDTILESNAAPTEARGS